MNSVKVRKLDSRALVPTRAHPHDAGLDLYALEDVAYRPGQIVKVSTGIAMSVPEGHVGLVRDRSSVSQLKLKVTAGVVDCGYTGDITVCLLNLSGEGGTIRAGTKVAQILVMPVSLMGVQVVDELDHSERGAKGFGSSGV